MAITHTPQFGDIFYADLIGGEHIQKGIRPVLIAQNNIGNKYSMTIEVIPLSTKIQKASRMPTHVLIYPTVTNGLKQTSIVLAEQVVTINKNRLLAFIGNMEEQYLLLIGKARKIQSPFWYE